MFQPKNRVFKLGFGGTRNLESYGFLVAKIGSLATKGGGRFGDLDSGCGKAFKGRLKESWGGIRDRFISVFGDAGRSLKHIHHRGYVCGDLSDGVQITKQ